MEGTTTQQPRTLLERLLEGKRRELDEATPRIFGKVGTMSKADWDYLAKLQDDIAWMEQRLAQREVPHG